MEEAGERRRWESLGENFGERIRPDLGPDQGCTEVGLPKKSVYRLIQKFCIRAQHAGFPFRPLQLRGLQRRFRLALTSRLGVSAWLLQLGCSECWEQVRIWKPHLGSFPRQEGGRE